MHKVVRSPSPPSSDAAPAQSFPVVSAAVLSPLLIGLTLRISNFLYHRSFWMDESMFGLNIALLPARSLNPMPFFEQVAAPLFVLLERASVLAFGVNEYALSLLPLLAGCALLPAIWFTGRATVGPHAALVALWAVATSPTLVRFSAQAKPYSVDALVALLLIGLTARVLRDPQARGPRLALLAAGIIGLMFSLASVFVLAAIGVTLLLARPGGHRVPLTATLGTAVAWLACLALLYFAIYDAEPARSFMQHFWSSSFLGSRGFSGTIRTLSDGLMDAFVHPRMSWLRIPLAAALIVGVVYSIRRQRWLALLLIAPIAFVILASFAHVYPFGGRVSLFTLPLTALLFGAGIVALAQRIRPPYRNFAIAGLALLLLGGNALGAVRQSVFAPDNAQSAVVVRDVLRRAAPFEPIYLYVRSVPHWLMYSTNWEAPDTARAFRLIRAVSQLGPNAGNAPPRGHAVRPDEGAALRFPFRSSVEILGISPGAEGLGSFTERVAPDSGWAAHEVNRIAREARPRVWVVVMHSRRSVERALLTELCSANSEVLYQTYGLEAAAYYVDFSPRRAVSAATDTRGSNLCSRVLGRLRRPAS